MIAGCRRHSLPASIVRAPVSNRPGPGSLPQRSACTSLRDVMSAANLTSIEPGPSSDAVRLRRAASGDLPALVELENTSFQVDRMSARQWRHHLESPAAEVWVAARARRLVGAVVMFFHRRHRIARLYSIAVAADERGRGVGELLLDAAEQAARRRDSRALRLEVRLDNRVAQHLYERHGYRCFATRSGYYEDGGDALRYEKNLKSPSCPNSTPR